MSPTAHNAVAVARVTRDEKKDIVCMSTHPKKNFYGKVAQFRIHPEAKRALTQAKLNLGETDLQFRGKSPTEEAIFNALCLWAAQQDGKALGECLAPFVARLEELVGKGGNGEEQGGRG